MKEFDKKRQEYYTREQAFTQDNARASKSFTDQIWKQLNQYVKDYGKDHGYKFIFGYDGQGAVMYGEEGANVTEQVKKYVNDRYKGGK
jgi:outer membrane protein